MPTNTPVPDHKEFRELSATQRQKLMNDGCLLEGDLVFGNFGCSVRSTGNALVSGSNLPGVWVKSDLKGYVRALAGYLSFGRIRDLQRFLINNDDVFIPLYRRLVDAAGAPVVAKTGEPPTPSKGGRSGRRFLS